jgi:hypothetical protein
MKTKILPFALAAILLLTACSLGSTPEPTSTPVNIGAIQTAAVETIVAAVTQTAAAFTETPEPTETLASPVLTPTAALTATPAGTPTGIVCDNMAFIGDVTVPDLTEMTAGQEFTKTWSIKNTGSCTWSTAYSIVFAYGSDKIWAKPSANLTAEVLPGQTAEISVTLKAPTKPGTYKAWYKMHNNNGYNFGEFFSVVIVVK